ncbi:MAG: hypothetical protein Kow0077_16920 [Anaerolineae bacterium]
MVSRNITGKLLLALATSSLLLLLLIIPGAGAQAPLAPDGIEGEIYYAPFPVSITLDGELEDWASVPQVTMPFGAVPEFADSAVTFAGAADDEFLYLLANVTDRNIITGQHGPNYWNEDSVEFYINATRDLNRRDYVDGVAQITIPPINIGRSQDDLIISGVRGTTVDARAIVVETENGWAVELALPLKNDVWNITPRHGEALGFQVHLNGASQRDRDTKLIWSIYDTSDQSYQNPRVFGRLIFFEAGREDIPPTPTPIPREVAGPTVEPDAAYRNPDLPIEERIDDLLARMTLAEKIGQMTLIEKNSMALEDIAYLGIGGLLSGGGGYPESGNTPERWAAMVAEFQEQALQSRLGIPLIYGVDAVHGHNNVVGATIFPHNVGLGAANNPELMTEIGRITALETAATNIFWDYAPVLAVTQDIRWGRAYESFGEDTDLVTTLATAFLRGLQGDDLAAPTTVAGTLKHFIADGATGWGTSTTGNYQIDQGVATLDEATLRAVHLPPYIAGLEAGARTVMVSYSSWNDTKMHAQRALITDLLKGELGFDGFVVSDWGGIDQIAPGDYYTSVVTAINAGIDMNMVPYDYSSFIGTLTKAVENGDVSLERIDDAVRRILRVKFELGLFEHPLGDPALLETVGSPEHREVARQAVRESLVLLKNDSGVLPLGPDTSVILVGGEAADDIGIQSGGWTIEWQGKEGNITPGTTILEGLQQAAGPDTAVYYNRFGRADRVRTPDGNPPQPDVCIAVVGERPYAEGVGDSADLTLNERDIPVLERMISECETVVAIIISGRPVIISDYVDDLDAIVAAWLPGTEGQGVADVLFGDYPFTGRLPFTWPRSVDQLPFDFAAMPEGEDGPLYPFGYGLTTE